MPTQTDFCHLGLAVIETEAAAIHDLTQRIDETFADACRLILSCTGRVIVTGMGKSGHIGKKIAATLASTGTPAFFVHPGEASHGDMGMITPKDIVIALSNSGSTQEILKIIPLLKRFGIPLISITGNPESPLAHSASVNLNVEVAQEACPLGLAPTSSTTASLVMGDALAIALLTARGFTTDDFALSHPGGALGKRLLLRIDDIMHQGDRLPTVNVSASLHDALLIMTEKQLGMTCVLDDTGDLAGIFTDGDLRRAFAASTNIYETNIASVMSRHPKTVSKGTLAAEALNLMQQHKITALVVSENQRPIGIIHMHDLLKAGVI